MMGAWVGWLYALLTAPLQPWIDRRRARQREIDAEAERHVQAWLDAAGTTIERGGENDQTS